MSAPEISIESFEIFATGVDHPECVALDAEGTLWAGGEAGQIYRIDSAGKVETVANLGSFNAGIAFSPDDVLFVCNPALGIVRVEKSGKWEVFADRIGDYKLVCPNFPVFDRAGNLYVSDSGKWRQRNGYLLRFSTGMRNHAAGGRDDRAPGILAGPFGYANGLALSVAENYIFMVESDTNSVLRLEIREDGSLGEPHKYAENTGRFPDGLALDSEGNLFVSCYASDEIFRVSPAGRMSLFAYDAWGIKLRSPTNMAFGGKDFDEMFFANLGRTTITRARVGRKGQPLANMKQRSLDRAMNSGSGAKR